MYNNPKYSIVIPTYNHLHDCLIPCLESIKQYTDLANIEVIVVANGCVDDTANYVNSLGYPFILIEEKEQLGYTKATNLGLKASKGEYIVLLNNDAQLLPQQKNYWLETMARPFEILERVGMTGPMLFKGIEGQSNDFVMFFCAMTTRKIIDEVGYLDEIYSPGGVEDVDYGLRLILADYKLLSVPLHEDVNKNPGMTTGSFPIFHPGGTTCSKEKGWHDILIRNNNILKQKFPDYFRGIDWIDSMEKKKQAEKKDFKVYDCFPFFNEIELLKIRLTELESVVDKFIITEARYTHSGKPKPLYLQENIHLFDKYKDKIILHTVDFSANIQDPWHRERMQRDAAFDVLHNMLTEKDYVIISDCDEIPSVPAIHQYINDNVEKIGILQQKRFMYYFNNQNVDTDEPQSNSRVISSKMLKKHNFTPCAIRYCDKFNLCPYYNIDNGGWHFTFMGGAEKVIEKIKSFAHMEYDTEEKTNLEEVKNNIKISKDVYNCNSSWKFVEIDETFPKLIREQIEFYIEKNYVFKQIESVETIKVENVEILQEKLNMIEPLMEKLKRIASFTYDEIFIHNVNGMEQSDYENSTVIDIGANVGCFAVKAVELGASIVHCFEPEIRNFSMLQDIASNYNCIKTYNFAVVDENKKFVQMCSEGAGANIYGHGDDVSEYVTPCISLGKIIDMINTEDLVVKLDCEGSEFEILFNLDASYYKKIRLLVVEIHDTLNKNYLYKSEKLISHIRSFNFDIDFTGPRAGVWYSPTEWVPSPLVLHRFRRK
jgi:beta-1,4-mannosyl-glycoprotein beta-1,4-N-acetylglucosaminyltransferase